MKESNSGTPTREETPRCCRPNASPPMSIRRAAAEPQRLGRSHAKRCYSFAKSDTPHARRRKKAEREILTRWVGFPLSPCLCQKDNRSTQAFQGLFQEKIHRFSTGYGEHPIRGRSEAARPDPRDNGSGWAVSLNLPEPARRGRQRPLPTETRRQQPSPRPNVPIPTEAHRCASDWRRPWPPPQAR